MALMSFLFPGKVRSGRNANASPRDLKSGDKDRDMMVDRIQHMITEGLRSGVSDKTVDDVWDRVKARNLNG